MDHTNPYQPQLDDLDQKIANARQMLADAELADLARDEITKLEAQKQQLQAAAAEYADSLAASETPTTPDFKNCIIELRGGAGGDEAKIWAADIQRMYIRFCERIGLKFELVDDLVLKVRGKTSQLTDPQTGEPLTAYQVFQFESGVHRVQRVPETESQGRIHTSTASVAVLPEVPATAVEVRDEDLDWQFMRSGGAGGQSVNKTSSAVRLTHAPSGLVIVSRQERKQAQNRQIALELLRSQLWEIQEAERLKEMGDARSAIGRQDRAEKIRTFNFPQNRVTDHRINESWHNLDTILEGDLADVVTAVRAQLSVTDATNT